MYVHSIVHTNSKQLAISAECKALCLAKAGQDLLLCSCFCSITEGHQWCNSLDLRHAVFRITAIWMSVLSGQVADTWCKCQRRCTAWLLHDINNLQAC